MPFMTSLWRRIPHRDLVVNSGTLFGSTIVTSVLGFAYWSLIARSAPASAVGTASTLVSALTLLGTVGMFGIGTMLIAELARLPERARTLLPASLLVAGLLSGVLAALFAGGSQLLGTSLAAALRSPVELALFVSGVILSAVTLVFDQASLGLQIAPVQLWRNVVFAVAKIALIPLIALAGGQDWAITATWVLGLVVSGLAVIPQLRRHRILPTGRPRLSALRSLGWSTAHHNTLNLSLSVPRMAVPVLVGLLQPGATTAAFYAAWMIASFLYSVPTHLATSLFAIAAGDLRALRSKVRMTLAVSFLVGLVALPVVIALAGPLMMIFGREYATAGAGCLILLALLYPTQVIKQHYAAVLRANGQVRRAGVVCSIAAAAELLAMVAAAARADITTVVVAQGVVLIAGAGYMLPAVLRALWAGDTAPTMRDAVIRSLVPRLGRIHWLRLAFRTVQLPLRGGLRVALRHVRRDPYVIVFGAPVGRFTDNAAYLFLAAREQLPEFRSVWITPSRALRDRLRSHGHEAETRWSLRGIRRCLTAGMYIYSCYPSDINRWLYDGAITFNLWHGVPLKRIERDIAAQANQTRSPRRAALLARAYADEHHVPDLLLSPSPFVSERCLTSAFAITAARCVNAGYPRTDHFTRPDQPSPITPLLPSKDQWHRLAQEKLVVGYFPTWRDSHSEFMGGRDGVFLRDLAAAVRRRGGVLLFKPHANTLNAPHAGDGDGIVTLQCADDVQAFLPLCDLLITDYSSIAFDFMLLGRPIIYYAPDIDTYLDERGLYFDISEAMPGQIVHRPHDLHHAVATIDLFEADRRIDAVRTMMWHHNTTGSATKIAERIRRTMIPGFRGPDLPSEPSAGDRRSRPPNTTPAFPGGDMSR